MKSSVYSQDMMFCTRKIVSPFLQMLCIVFIALCLTLGDRFFKDKSLLAPAIQSKSATIPSLSIEEAASLHAQGSAVFLDVRHAMDYLDSHLPGAGNLPFTQSTQHNNPIHIILYCSGASCGKARLMAQYIQEKGLNIAIMPEGIRQWLAQDRQLEMSQ